MKELTIILLMVVISVTESKTVIKEDKAVSQVEGDGDEMMVTAEQVFLPRFATRLKAASRRAHIQRRTYKRRNKNRQPQRRKYQNQRQNWRPGHLYRF